MKRCHLSKSILNHISEDFPCGSDCKYEDRYLEIENEISKSANITDDIKTDWSKVASNAEIILSQHSKDIKLICWWVYAKYKTNSIDGLKDALDNFNSLMVTFEKKLLPKSNKIKISSLLWLENLLTKELLNERGDLNFSLDTKIFLTYFRNLQTNFSKVIEKDTILFKKIQNILQNLENKQEKDTKKNISVNATTPTTKISQINSDDEAKELLRQLKKDAKLLQEYYIKEDSSDLKAIRLTRFLSWFEINELPIQTDGKILLNPPSQESINIIETLIEEEKFTEVLEKIENMISLSSFWLEGHFIAFTILNKMGHTQTAKEVENSLLSFIRRDEKILELNFKDSSPICSTKFKKWVSKSINSSDTFNANQDSQINEKEQIEEQAFLLAKKKNIKEAMALLGNSYNRAISKEDKFGWRLIKTKLAIESGKTNIALALLEDLRKDIKLYRLDEWNPDLAAKVFVLFLNFKHPQIDTEDIDFVYKCLCKIDIEKALEIKHKNL